MLLVSSLIPFFPSSFYLSIWLGEYADLYLEKNGFIIECIPFESPREEDQTGFFHSVSIPVRTFRVFRPHQVDIYTYPKGKVEEGRRGQMSLIK